MEKYRKSGRTAFLEAEELFFKEHYGSIENPKEEILKSLKTK